MKDKIINVARHRMESDGEGVTSLIVFPGCPLQCKYCINDYCHDKNIKTHELSPEDLYRLVMLDEIYFLMTGGGVVFGGGEPILHSSFIKEFAELVKQKWKILIETSLNCSWDYVQCLIPYIDQWIIDIKDLNPDIYRRYTGVGNDLVISNINKLSSIVDKGKIVFRVPLIPEFNTEADRERSVQQLFPFGKIDLFEYVK